MAIVNPAQITPYSEIPEEPRGLAEDLILNRRLDALQRLIEYFAAQSGEQVTSGSAAANPMEGMSAEERLHHRILFRRKDGIEADVDENHRPESVPQPATNAPCIS